MSKSNSKRATIFAAAALGVAGIGLGGCTQAGHLVRGIVHGGADGAAEGLRDGEAAAAHQALINAQTRMNRVNADDQSSVTAVTPARTWDR